MGWAASAGPRVSFPSSWSTLRTYGALFSRVYEHVAAGFTGVRHCQQGRVGFGDHRTTDRILNTAHSDHSHAWSYLALLVMI